MASDDEGAARIGGPERGKFAGDARPVGEARNAHVNIGMRTGGNHVALRAAGCHSHAYGEATLEVGPAADGFDDARELEKGVGAFFKVDAGVGGDAFDYDVPVADAFARGFIGEALRRLEDVDGGAPAREIFGDGPRDGAADLFVAVEQQNDFAAQQASFNEEFDGGRGHGDAGLHIESSWPPETTFANAAGHGLERAERPHRIEMAEEEDFFLVLEASGTRTKMGFENIAVVSLPVEFNAAAELLEVRGGEGNACVDRGFRVGGRFCLNQFAREIEE